MQPKTDLVVQAIKRAFGNGDEYSDANVQQIVFHLTDWIDDLGPFVDFLENPDKYGDDQVLEIIIAFLAHAPYHLNIAAEIVLEPGQEK